MNLSLGGTLGAGAGLVKAKSPVAWENIEHPTYTLPYYQRPSAVKIFAALRKNLLHRLSMSLMQRPACGRKPPACRRTDRHISFCLMSLEGQTLYPDLQHPGFLTGQFIFVVMLALRANPFEPQARRYNSTPALYETAFSGESKP